MREQTLRAVVQGGGGEDEWWEARCWNLIYNRDLVLIETGGQMTQVAKQRCGHVAGIFAATMRWPCAGRCGRCWRRMHEPAREFTFAFHISTAFGSCDGSRRKQQADHQRFFSNRKPVIFSNERRARQRMRKRCSLLRVEGQTGNASARMVSQEGCYAVDYGLDVRFVFWRQRRGSEGKGGGGEKWKAAAASCVMRDERRRRRRRQVREGDAPGLLLESSAQMRDSRWS
jgi:hypothetical protein